MNSAVSNLRLHCSLIAKIIAFKTLDKGCFLGFGVVKFLFTTICFVGFYSVPNLIVIIFNLLYPVCIVRFHCKGCVIERVV